MSNPPSIIGTASVRWTKGRRWAFKKNYFDIILEDDLWGGQESFEKSESKIQEEAIKLAITNANLSPKDIEYLFLEIY